MKKILAIDNFPQKPGVYLFKDERNKIIYIGKAINLKSRVNSYFQKGISLGPRTQQLVKQVRNIDYIIVESEVEALLLEANLIQKHQPKYNIELKNGKKYPYIKITNDEYPRVLLVRKAENDKSCYFGPYPDGTSVRKILSFLRHIFPYCTHKKPYKSCLFIHLGLCPGPGSVVSRQEYGKAIRNITYFLQGKKLTVLHNLKKEMITLAKKEEYRKADQIKKQIERIQIITQEVRKPYEYLSNPNLATDNAKKSLLELVKFLQLKKVPQRIECYDVSNISGQMTTAGMSVMINGQTDTSLYRKFKIPNAKINDVASLIETITRRLNHNEWPFPDLIIVDGGVVQANEIQKVINLYNINIPVIGLAKRFEEVYLPGNPKPISTKTNSEARFMLQQIRNEAHRFAKSYHLKIRAKNMLR